MENLESQPYPPLIHSSDAKGERTEIKVGQNFTVECHSYVGEKGSLRFALFNGTEFAFLNSSVPQVSREDPRTDHTDKCSKFAQTILSLPMTPDLDGKTLSCVSGSIGHVAVCSDADRYCEAITTFTTDDLSPPKIMKLDIMVIIIGGLGLLILLIIIAVIAKKVMTKKKPADAGAAGGGEGPQGEKPPSESGRKSDEAAPDEEGEAEPEEKEPEDAADQEAAPSQHRGSKGSGRSA